VFLTQCRSPAKGKFEKRATVIFESGKHSLIKSKPHFSYRSLHAALPLSAKRNVRVMLLAAIKNCPFSSNTVVCIELLSFEVDISSIT